MSFLATAPDDGYPGAYPAPGSSACGADPAGSAPSAGLAALPGNPGPVCMVLPAGGAAPDDGQAAPLVDPAALQDLGAGLDNPAAARDFARDYIKLWDQRRRSLAAALERGDEAASLDAVLSLKIASAMVGGIRLSRIAGKVEDAIRGGDLDRAKSYLPEVEEHGRETVNGLRASQDLPEI